MSKAEIISIKTLFQKFPQLIEPGDEVHVKGYPAVTGTLTSEGLISSSLTDSPVSTSKFAKTCLEEHSHRTKPISISGRLYVVVSKNSLLLRDLDNMVRNEKKTEKKPTVLVPAKPPKRKGPLTPTSDEIQMAKKVRKVKEEMDQLTEEDLAAYKKVQEYIEAADELKLAFEMD